MGISLELGNHDSNQEPHDNDHDHEFDQRKIVPVTYCHLRGPPFGSCFYPQFAHAGAWEFKRWRLFARGIIRSEAQKERHCLLVPRRGTG